MLKKTFFLKYGCTDKYVLFQKNSYWIKKNCLGLCRQEALVKKVIAFKNKGIKMFFIFP